MAGNVHIVGVVGQVGELGEPEVPLTGDHEGVGTQGPGLGCLGRVEVPLQRGGCPPRRLRSTVADYVDLGQHRGQLISLPWPELRESLPGAAAQRRGLVGMTGQQCCPRLDVRGGGRFPGVR